MNRTSISVIVLLTFLSAIFLSSAASPTLQAEFKSPPDDARPWVFWFWNNGNITREGITADLEAMKRVGIGGVLIMEVAVGAPAGPVPFMSDQWRGLFKHVVSEAQRLGLQVNMNNDAGWTGSGGPWIKPEQSMKKLVFSELEVKGPGHHDAYIAQPESHPNYYRDVAVLAFPTPEGNYRLTNISFKACYEYNTQAPDVPMGAISPKEAIRPEHVVNISNRMDGDGRLAWEVPPGQWTIMRFGYTSRGNGNGPAPQTGGGLECDKFSKEGIETQFNAMIGKLIVDVGFAAGRTFAATHIDSWEVGAQNWTDRMPEEFLRRRGYAITNYLPVFAGRVVGSVEISERFLCDLRQTVSDLIAENYIGHMRTLANRHGLRFSMEAYGGPFDELACASTVDEPIGEFWVPNGYQPFLQSIKEMSSAAHIYGRPIVGAEAFTAMATERWQHHPGSLKAWGDMAFCSGVNRFIFHRFAHQPWLDVKPGMSMGPYGIHYERTQTWWEHTRAWHEYLARCQWLLRQGQFVADVCYLQSEYAPQTMPLRKGERYDYDACTPALVLGEMRVDNGLLRLPGGMSYRVMVLPEPNIASPGLLRKIKSLIEAGATVIGSPPERAPGLTDYPRCDHEVKQLVAEIWGDCNGEFVKQRRLGKGRIICGLGPCEVLQGQGIPPDFEADGEILFIHRRLPNRDLYFLSNQTGQQTDVNCTFRVTGKQPELWDPQTGLVYKVNHYTDHGGRISLPLRLEPGGSVFAVFVPHKGRRMALVTGVLRNQKPLDLTPAARTAALGSLTMAFWAKPQVGIDLPLEKTAGLEGTTARRNDVIFPTQGEIAFGKKHASAGVSVGTNGICVYEHSADYLAPVLVCRANLDRWTHIAVAYRTNLPTLYIDGQPARTGSISPMIVHSGISTDDTRFAGAAFKGKFTGVRQWGAAATEQEILETMAATRSSTDDNYPGISAPEALPAIDLVKGEISAPGSYEIRWNNGVTKTIDASSLPGPVAVQGPWKVTFSGNSGPPGGILLERLISLSDHPDNAVKHFSGLTTYSKAVVVPKHGLKKNHRVYLDLGKVEVTAKVRLNGREVATLWVEPYRVEISKALKPGQNLLEIEVANLWINRMIGDELLAEDSLRNQEGNIKEWPEWLREGRPSPSGRVTFTSWRLWKMDETLRPSGLLGPVRIVFTCTWQTDQEE